MENVFDELKERGLIKQTIYEDDLRKKLGKEKIVCYIGFDPTAPSLHIGNLLSLLLLVRMQKAGHYPIALLGGATSRIGDPSFRNDMRPMMSEETRLSNLTKIKAQISKFFDNNCENKLIIVNNDDWMSKLTYIDMLNSVGTALSVNKMLSHDCFKNRMETGLSFLEFNYMPMQAYDFMHLNKEFNCVLEMGGSDQWANCLAGVELIRRTSGKPVFCLTAPLLTKSDGTKMGKSAKGAMWLDGEMMPDYDFYQYFRDVEDSKVEELFRFLTFVPLTEIKEICGACKGQDWNIAKERLAFEITKIVRGEQSAQKAQEQAKATFGNGNIEEIPSKELNNCGKNIIDILLATKLATSRGDAKKLILGAGVRIDEQIISDLDYNVDKNEFILKKGKKTIIKVVLK